ncbi:Peptidase M23 [Solidesulfovibrio fructosivorans JJ]]|uniref:Peptidase M23 n=1 Tax=Solidesulfovibrio fructosivorans JJ] TaxID=596151 RepID=E1JY86_SOLFR|nr:M23 family metallopeptidase [Solidesulfovibrio fructosivorans]EFL50660.1 Peptidase M23 [Solidesulfovibrio fructosivorans JJ]]
MLERKLDIFVHDHNGVRRLFTYRRWMFLVSVSAVAVLAAGMVVLWRYQADYADLAARRRAALERLAGQKAEALRLRDRVRRLGDEAARIRSFDAKLGVMVEVPEGLGMGAPDTPARLPGSALGDDLGRRLFDFLAALGNRMAVEEALQQDLARLLGERKLEFLAKPSLWPARGYITSGFGRRQSPFGRGGDFHNGVDIKVPIGSPVYAAGAGRVTEAGYMHGYGLRIVISHDFGLETIYAHMQKAEVKPGEQVKRGQRIGLSGNSGRTTGAHLHYEVRVDDTPVNPRRYLLD